MIALFLLLLASAARAQILVVDFNNGDAAESSGRSADGGLDGTVTDATVTIGPDGSGALYFDGVGDNSFNGGALFTYGAHTVNAEFGLGVGTTTGDFVALTSGEPNLEATNAAHRSGWHHCCATFDGAGGTAASLVTVYYDASVLMESTTPLDTGATYPLYVGNRPPTDSASVGAPFIGSVDDLRVYDYELAADAIYQLYTATPAPVASPTPAPTPWPTPWHPTPWPTPAPTPWPTPADRPLQFETPSPSSSGACLCHGAEFLRGVVIPGDDWAGRQCDSQELEWACLADADEGGRLYLAESCCGTNTSSAAAPQVASAKFGDSGAVVVVELDAASDRGDYGGASFPCADAVEVFGWDYSTRRLDDTTCVFLSDSQFEMVLPSTSAVVPGDAVALLVDAVGPKAGDACGSNYQSTRATVAAPDDPPEVRLALPASPVTAAACDGLTLDASATSGGGGRGLAFEWFVDGTFAGDRSVLAVPDLVAGDSYAVTVVASSFLNVTARAALVVNAVAEARRRFAWTCDGLPCGDGASSLAVNAPAAGVVATYAVLVAAADGRNATARASSRRRQVAADARAAAPAGKVDPSSRLKIATTVSGASPGTTFAWSLESGALEESLEAAALAPLVAEAEGDALSVPLVLAAGSLTPGGAYGFRLAASDGDDVVAFASVAVRTTTLAFGTSSPHYETQLPAGERTCAVDVADAYGATASAEAVVAVAASQKNASALRNASLEAIDAAFGASDVQAVYASLNIAATNEVLVDGGNASAPCGGDCGASESRGACAFYDANGDAADEARSSYAACACAAGWAGDACGLSPDDAAATDAYRESLLVALAGARDLQDPHSRDAVAQQAATLEGLTASRLSESGARTALGVAAAVAADCRLAGLGEGARRDETAGAVAGALSNLATGLGTPRPRTRSPRRRRFAAALVDGAAAGQFADVATSPRVAVSSRRGAALVSFSTNVRKSAATPVDSAVVRVLFDDRCGDGRRLEGKKATSFTLTLPGAGNGSACASFDAGGGDWAYDDCVFVESTDDNATCLCESKAGADYSTTNLEYYLDALSAPITLGTLRDNPVILTTLGVIVGLCVIAMVIGRYLDRRDAARAAALPARTPLRHTTTSSAASDAKLRKQTAINVSAGIARASLPDFVLGLHDAPRFGARLIYENHSIISLFSVFDATLSRPARAVAVLFNMVMILAAEAMAFWIEYPLGYCEDVDERDACLDRSLMYDEAWAFMSGRNSPRRGCEWRDVVTKEDGHRCELRVPDGLSGRSLFLELFVVLLTLPVMKLFDYVFVRYVMAPLQKSRGKVEPAPAEEAGDVDDARAAVARLRQNLGLAPSRPADALRPTADAVVRKGCQECLVPVMRALHARGVELEHAFDALGDRRARADGIFDGLPEPYDRCCLFFELLRCDALTLVERGIVETWGEKLGGEEVSVKAVSLPAKAAGMIAWLAAFLYPVYFVLQFAQALDDRGETGSELKREWFLDTMQFLVFCYVTIEPLIILITQVMVPLAVRDKLLFLENPANKRVAYRTPLRVEPSVLVDLDRVEAFGAVGATCPASRRGPDHRAAFASAACEEKEEAPSADGAPAKDSTRPSLGGAVLEQFLDQEESGALRAAAGEFRAFLGTAGETRDLDDAHRARGGAQSLWASGAIVAFSRAVVFRPAWYQRLLGWTGALIQSLPEIPRDTFLEEYIAVVVFALIGFVQNDDRARAVLNSINSAIPGAVVVLGCMALCFFIVAGGLLAIEVVEKADAARVVAVEGHELGDENLDLEERLHRHRVREAAEALEKLWADYERAAGAPPSPRDAYKTATVPSARTLDAFLTDFVPNATKKPPPLVLTASELSLGLKSPETPNQGFRKAKTGDLPPLDGGSDGPDAPQGENR
ncbi:hypothetical protein JL722_68 [Aureococcus anophagefferens]|nr:hypothetical protein JL722_68 [Aureococcus anophagefferens]